ncbi:replication protein A 70 kDa DNA-binding subunit B [Tanacetum coccineum]
MGYHLYDPYENKVSVARYAQLFENSLKFTRSNGSLTLLKASGSYNDVTHIHRSARIPHDMFLYQSSCIDLTLYLDNGTVSKSQQKGNKSLPNESKSSSKKKTLKHSPAMQTSNKITTIKDVGPMDEHGDRIQVYVKKDWMFRSEPLLQDGICYLISNFGVTENGRRLPLLQHDWKLSFYKNTNVTRIYQFDDNFTGFKSEPFTRILDTNEEYKENKFVDVIGIVVRIGEIVAVNFIGLKMIRRAVVIEDEEGERIDLTFWDSWAKKWNEYAEKLDSRYVPAVHNALFGTKLYINKQLSELLTFRQRYESREDYEANKNKIQLVAHEIKVVTPQQFMNGAVKKLVGSIRETEPDTECVIYAIVHSIKYESGWTYIGCKLCSKKVEPVTAKGPSTSRTKKTWWCSQHEIQEQVASRYKMIVRVIDESGTAQLCIFDGNMHKMSGYTAWELIEKYDPDTSTYFLEELDEIIGKRFLFRVKFSEYNHNNNSHVYRCENVSNDEAIINFWKEGFVGDQDSEEDSEEDIEENNEEDMEDGMETPATPIKSTNVLDLSITHRLQLETPTGDSIGSSSVHTSGSEKKRQRTVERGIVVIDLSDSEYDTENDEKEPTAKKAMVAVDQEAIAQKAIVTIKKEKDVEQNIEKDEEPK